MGDPTETFFGKNLFDVYFDVLFSLAHVSSINMDRVEFMTSTAARHKGAIEMFWLHFVMCPSIYTVIALQLTDTFGTKGFSPHNFR